MPSVDVVFIGDLHIGSLTNLFPDREDSDILILESTKPALNYARENGVKTVVLLGDIYDTPYPTQEQQALFFDYLYRNRDLDFYIIPGNHDLELEAGVVSLHTADAITRLKLLPHVKLFLHRAEVEISGVPFTFMPWPIIKTNKKRTSINIAHVPSIGAKSDSGRVFKEGEAFKLNTAKDYWFVGDLHQHQKSKHVVYPGTMFQKTFGEKLPKGFVFASIKFKSNKLTVKHKFIPCEPPFTLETIKIDTLDDLKKIPKYIDDPILSPHIKRFKIILGKDMVLPPNFLVDNPHVVKWDKNSKLRTVTVEDTVEVGSIRSLNMREMIYSDLKPFLTKEGLGKREVKRGIAIVDAIVTKLGGADG